MIVENKRSEDQKYVNNISNKRNFVKKKAQEILNEKGKLPQMLQFDHFIIFCINQSGRLCNSPSDTERMLEIDGFFRQ